MRNKSQIKDGCGGKKEKTKVVETKAIIKVNVSARSQVPLNGDKKKFGQLNKGTEITVFTDKDTHGDWRVISPNSAPRRKRQIQMKFIKFA